jgi:hypothetical protein
MNVTDALRVLNLSTTPKTATDLANTYSHRIQVARLRFNSVTADSDKKRIIAEIKEITEAYQTLLTHIGQGVTPSPRPQPKPQPPPRPQPRPQPTPSPLPPTPRPQPVPTPAKRRALWIYLQSLRGWYGAIKPSLKGIRTMGANFVKATVILAFCAGILLLAYLGYTAAFTGTAQVEIWTWPPSRVFIDNHVYLGEAPSPYLREVPAGSHLFTVEPKDGSSPYSFRARVFPRRNYLFDIDLEKRAFKKERNKQ